MSGTHRDHYSAAPDRHGKADSERGPQSVVGNESTSGAPTLGLQPAGGRRPQVAWPIKFAYDFPEAVITAGSHLPLIPFLFFSPLESKTQQGPGKGSHRKPRQMSFCSTLGPYSWLRVQALKSGCRLHLFLVRVHGQVTSPLCPNFPHLQNGVIAVSPPRVVVRHKGVNPAHTGLRTEPVSAEAL